MKGSKRIQVAWAGDRASHISVVARLVSLVVIGVLSGARANAQTAAQAAEIVKTLSGHSREVVQRLTELNQLPSGDWRIHPGDLAHGESPDLDEPPSPGPRTEWRVVS